MIEVSRLNGQKYVLNCDLIKTIEATPDTIITLVSGEKLMVRESVDYVRQESLKQRSISRVWSRNLTESQME